MLLGRSILWEGAPVGHAVNEAAVVALSMSTYHGVRQNRELQDLRVK